MTKSPEDHKKRINPRLKEPNRLLERLASKLLLNGPSLEFRGAPPKRRKPTTYNYDVALALCEAGNDDEDGWYIFGAKYLCEQTSVDELYRRLKRQFHFCEHAEQLARITVAWFCTGVKISDRGMRRTLDINRETSTKYRRLIVVELERLLKAEERYAKDVAERLG